MPAGNAITELAIRIKSDASRFDRDLDRALRRGGLKFRNFASVVATAGTAAAAGLTAFVAVVARSATNLDQTAQKLGITTEALAAFRYGAEQSGLSSNTLDMALQRMTRRMAEAANGTGEAKDAIKELGLDAAELADAGPEAALNAIADAMVKVDSKSQRLRLAFKLFDSEGVAMVNLLERGSEGLAEFRIRAEEMGVALSQDNTEALRKVDAAILDLKAQAQGLANVIAIELVGAAEMVNPAFDFPTLGQSFKGLVEVAKGTGQAITATGGIASATFKEWQADVADGIALIINASQSSLEAFVSAAETSLNAVLTFVDKVANGIRDKINPVLETLNAVSPVDVPLVPESNLGGSVDLGEVSFGEEAKQRFAAEADKLRKQAAAGRDTFDREGFNAGESFDLAKEFFKGERDPIEGRGIDELTEALQRLRDAAEGAGNSVGGGGGKSGVGDKAKEAADKMEEEAKRIKEAIRTPQQVLDDTVKRLTELRDAGKLTFEEFNLAVADAYEKFKAAADETALSWDTALEQMGGAVSEFARTGQLSFDSLRDWAVQAAVDVATAWIQSQAQAAAVGASAPAGAVGGGIGGGGGGGFWSTALSVVGGLLGGFFADGGRPPMGRVSVVGERGPELFVPDSPGTVLPNGTGVGGSAVIHNHFARGLDRVEVAAMLAESERRTVAQVVEMVAGGGAYRRGIRT